MEITIRNTTPQITPILFDNGDEYILQSGGQVTLAGTVGSSIIVNEDKIVASEVDSPLGLDESTDEEV